MPKPEDVPQPHVPVMDDPGQPEVPPLPTPPPADVRDARREERQAMVEQRKQDRQQRMARDQAVRVDGLALRAPDGSVWTLKVDADGKLSTAPLEAAPPVEPPVDNVVVDGVPSVPSVQQ